MSGASSNRILSIFKKADLSPVDFPPTLINIQEDAEHRLALQISKFAERLKQAARENYPHYLCGYIYELAGLFMKFYESCPILRSDVERSTKTSRLALAALSAQTLQTSLSLLGIPVVERM